MAVVNCADLVRLKASGEQWRVACVHDYVVYLCAPGDAVRRDDIELVQEATAEQREAMIASLAAGTGEGHRPRCARERMQAQIDEQIDPGDCC